MDSMDYWRLCDELSVLEAALLIVDVDPSGEAGSNCENWQPEEQPIGYVAAKAALVHAINGGRLVATVRHAGREYGWADKMSDVEASEANYFTVTGSTLDDDERLSPGQEFVYRISPDWALTTIRVEDLRAWLASRGLKSGFFFADSAATPDYLDRRHQRFAPKLAAAVSAWLAVEDPKGKTAKQALEKWLREHAAEFGLSDEDGKPNELGIEECAKVANWKPGGGAPRTPAG